MESYPVIPLFTGVGIITFLISLYIVRKTKPFMKKLPSFSEKIKTTILYIALVGVGLFFIPKLAKLETSQNIFTNELQANGMYRFYLAFMNSELEYKKFYKKLPEKDAFAILKNQLPQIQNNSTLRLITSDSTEVRKNVILITIESLSADFMKEYGNEQNITPFLDQLIQKSLQFSNLYAVGNRTVRGLEAFAYRQRLAKVL
jgi:glucan phosphoethanolaminetransferase (alkaline phosphatase superfamily)